MIDGLIGNQQFGCRSQRLAAAGVAGVARMCPTGHLQAQAMAALEAVGSGPEQRRMTEQDYRAEEDAMEQRRRMMEQRRRMTEHRRGTMEQRRRTTEQDYEQRSM